MKSEVNLETLSNEAWTTCDVCGFEFKTQDTPIQTKLLTVANEEMRMTFFACENCGEVYVIGFENGDTFRALEKLQEARSRYELGRKRKMSERALKRLLKASDKSLEAYRSEYMRLQRRCEFLRTMFRTLKDVEAVSNIDLFEENNTTKGA